jgi:hypothetical protein
MSARYSFHYSDDFLTLPKSQKQVDSVQRSRMYAVAASFEDLAWDPVQSDQLRFFDIPSSAIVDHVELAQNNTDVSWTFFVALYQKGEINDGNLIFDWLDVPTADFNSGQWFTPNASINGWTFASPHTPLWQLAGLAMDPLETWVAAWRWKHATPASVAAADCAMTFRYRVP